MFVYSIVFTYWAPTRCNLHTRYWEQHVFPKHLCLIPVVNSFCCPMSWFLKGWVMPCDALILARKGKLACHDHHQNPSKSLGRHVSVQQEHCQCPGSFQAHRSLCIATVLRIQSAAIFFLATTQCSPRTEKVGILSWRKWYCSLTEDSFSGALENWKAVHLETSLVLYAVRNGDRWPSYYFISFRELGVSFHSGFLGIQAQILKFLW